MENTVKLAIAKAITAKDVKAARQELSAGTYTVNSLIRVKGTVIISEDFPKKVTAKLKPLAGLAVALRYVPSAERVHVFNACLGIGVTPEAVAEVESELKTFDIMLRGTTITTIQGMVTTKLETFEVE